MKPEIGNCKVNRRPKALRHFQQAQWIYASLNLDFRAEQCQTARCFADTARVAQLQRRPLRHLYANRGATQGMSYCPLVLHLQVLSPLN
jgi:hypothetical protein